MPKEGIKFTAKPTLAQVKQRIGRAREKLRHTEDAHARIAVFLDRWVQNNFRTEGGNVGGWEPFAHGGRFLRGGGIDTSAKLLQDTGRLRASFVPFKSRGNAGIGSDLPYSETHEEGLGNVPKRRMLPETRDVRKDVAEIYDNFVRISTRGIGRSRRR